MTRTGNVNHVEVVLPDHAIEVNPGKCLPRIGTPVTEQAILEVLGQQRLAQQWIVAQVNHARAEIVAGTPIGIHIAQLVGGEYLLGGRLYLFGLGCLDVMKQLLRWSAVMVVRIPCGHCRVSKQQFSVGACVQGYQC